MSVAGKGMVGVEGGGRGRNQASRNVKTVDYYRNRHVSKFMERYGPIIRQLSVLFWKCASDAEWKFYKGFKVLEQLVIDEMALPSSSGKTSIPSSIQKKLKLLDISYAE
jgi:hypothetical protein